MIMQEEDHQLTTRLLQIERIPERMAFSNVLDFKVYSLEEMVVATNNFDPSNLLGEGSNGQVFQGITPDGQEIAGLWLSSDCLGIFFTKSQAKWKVLNKANVQPVVHSQIQESTPKFEERWGQLRFLFSVAWDCALMEATELFVNEIRRIGSINHRKIMELLGFCLEGRSPLLVSRTLYSLHTALYEDRTLDWEARYKIAINITKGLSYLHTGTHHLMIHCDIKSRNILLDPKTLQAYIADFGLVHLGSHQSVGGVEEIEVSWYYGTPGYWAPEVRLKKRMSAKSDVYRYGKLLYALISNNEDVQRMPPSLSAMEFQDDDVIFPVLEEEEEEDLRINLRLGGEGSNDQVFQGIMPDGREIIVKRLGESDRRVMEENMLFVNEICRIGTEMVVATHNFDPSNLLGEGSNGQVFRGILPDGQEIAVKRLGESDRRVMEETELFVNEIRRIGSVSHRNIMELLGFCLEGRSPLLVSRKLYSLHTALYEDRTLDWEARYKIAIDIAKGPSYLHTGTRRLMIHCDIKPGNILLDPETLQAYIADFGLVHLGRHQSAGGVEEIEVGWYYGTPGYWAPEVRLKKRLSAKSDVYSYGKLLYALISNKEDVQTMPPSLRNKLGAPNICWRVVLFVKIWSFRLFPWIRVLVRRCNLGEVDPRVRKEVEKSGRKIMQMTAALRLVVLCTQSDAATRPSMERVVRELEGANLCEIPWAIRAALRMGFAWYRLLASILCFLGLLYAASCAFFLLTVISFSPHDECHYYYPWNIMPLESIICGVIVVLILQLVLWWALPALSRADELLYRRPDEDDKIRWKHTDQSL
eukprot:Gb_15267 [translate_table: standard]